MKQRIKLLPMILAIVMVLSLTACGNKNVRGSVSPDNNAANSEAPVAEEVTFKSGSTNSGVYTNEFLGIGCQLDDSWTFFNDEQIAELSGMVTDAADNENLTESLDSGKLIYDMYAASSDGLASINIAIQDIGVIYGTALDESALIDISMESTKSMMESSGFTNYNIEKGTVDFAGAERVALLIKGEISGMPIYERVISIKKGNYLACISLSSFNEDITTDLSNLFYELP